MSRKQANVRLAGLLSEADWTAAALARAVCRHAARSGLALRYDRSSVAHWLSGSRPAAPVPEVVAAAISQRLGRTVEAWETGLTEFHGHLVRPTGDALGDLAALCRADSDSSAGEELRRAPYIPPTAPPPTTQDTRPEGGSFVHEPGPGPCRVAQSAVQGQMTAMFADLADRYGGGHTRAALTAYIRDISSPPVHPDALGPPHKAEPRVLQEMAQNAHLLGLVNADSGHAALAQKYFHLAWRLADEAGVPRLSAIALRALSAQALSYGCIRPALLLADAAYQQAEASGEPGVRAFAVGLLSHVQALTGSESEARSGLRSADRHLALSQSDADSPFSVYPRAGLLFRQAQTLLALGDLDPAIAVLEESLDARPVDQLRALALTHAKMAEACLRTDRTDAALEQWRLFLDLFPSLRSFQAERALSLMRRRLRRYPTVAEAKALLSRAEAVRPLSPPRRAPIAVGDVLRVAARTDRTARCTHVSCEYRRSRCGNWRPGD